MRPWPPPSAMRRAISFSREMARASCSPPMLAQAIRRMTPTASIMIVRGCVNWRRAPARPDCAVVRVAAEQPSPGLMSGFSPAERARRNIVSTSACARSAGTPGLARPTITSQAEPASSSAGFQRGVSRGRIDIGINRSYRFPGVRLVKLRAATPTMTVGTPFSPTVLPMTSGDPLKSRSQ